MDRPADRQNERRRAKGGGGATHPALFSSLGVGGAVRRGGVEYYLEERKGGPIDHAKIGGRGELEGKPCSFFGGGSIAVRPSSLLVSMRGLHRFSKMNE